MSAWITGLGSLGGETGQAVVAARQLKFAEGLKVFQQQLAAERLAQQQWYEQARILQSERSQQSLDAFRKSTEDYRKETQKTLDAYRSLRLLLQEKRPGPETELQHLRDRAQMADELGLKGQERVDFIGKLRRPAATGAVQDTGGIADLAQNVANGQMSLKDLPVKQRAAVATFMRQHGMKVAPPVAKLTPQERMAVDVIHQGLPMIDKVIGLLEPLRGDNSMTAAAESRARWFAYRHGFKVSEPWQSYIQVAALLRVMNTQQFLHGIRNLKFVEQIQQHMPNPEVDTPAMAYEKAIRMKSLMQQMLSEYGGAAGTAMPSGGTSRPSPDQQLDDALKAIGRP